VLVWAVPSFGAGYDPTSGLPDLLTLTNLLFNEAGAHVGSSTEVNAEQRLCHLELGTDTESNQFLRC